jgi:hypothetical protein
MCGCCVRVLWVPGRGLDARVLHRDRLRAACGMDVLL